MVKSSNLFLWSGMVLILMVGLIHVMDAKDSFSDAAYKGWLFYANGGTAVIVAYGIYRKQNWAWNLALIVAVGSFGGYVASRTVGLPFIPAEPENWFEPLGITSLVTEGLFVVTFFGRKYVSHEIILPKINQ